MAISKRVRFEVMRRDGHACRYCGAMAPEVRLTIDHVMPVALGGRDEPGNLVTACADCNSGKTSTSPDTKVVADVAEADLNLAEALKRAAGEVIAEAEGAEWNEYADNFLFMWREFATPMGKEVPLPQDWRRSVKRWAASGLPEELMAEALYIAMQKYGLPPQRVFRYMCGVVNNQVKKIHERAAQIMSEDAATVPSEAAEV